MDDAGDENAAGREFVKKVATNSNVVAFFCEYHENLLGKIYVPKLLTVVL